MSFLDHLLVLFFALGVPYLSYKSYPMIKSELEKGASGFREQLYKSASIQQWIIVSFLLGLYSYHERDWLALGFVPVQDTPASWLGFAIVAGYVGFSVYVLQNARTGGSWDLRLRTWMKTMPGAEVGPTNEREMQWFVWVSLTAGICEEIIYRGYLMWYFAAYTDQWTALILTSVLFGLNHLYQGGRGVIRTGLVGALLGYLYIVTGSLLIPILLHVVIDFYSGKMILFSHQGHVQHRK